MSQRSLKYLSSILNNKKTKREVLCVWTYFLSKNKYFFCPQLLVLEEGCKFILKQLLSQRWRLENFEQQRTAFQFAIN